MYRLFFGFFSLIFISLSSCQSSTTTEADANLTQAQEIYDEAIVVHDEVMPRMDEMMRLRRTVQQQMDSLQQVDSVAYADTLQQMQTIVQNLKEADDAMMQWMRNTVGVPTQEELQSPDPVDTTNIIQVQQQQKAAIEQVKQQMESSIEEAKALLNE
ncbi:MAG: hypothetical protein AAGE93_11410 [Bacteroidota bacterium]|mgnify:FL=1